MYHPKHWRDGRVRTEHETLKNELEYIEIADRAGFKYSWSAEHHFLDEYSHLSASESFMAVCHRPNQKIHVGSAIMNITRDVNHPGPMRGAGRPCSTTLSEGRFEFGTGRGSSSTEVYGFGIPSMERTSELWDESLPQIVRMWREEEYAYEGDSFSMPPRRVLPKPYTNPHPPIWVAAGSPGTFEKAARLGIGVLCFTLGTPDTLAPLIEIYKKNIEKAEPVGDYVNNNIMVTGDMLCLDDGDRARQLFSTNNSRTTTPVLFSSISTPFLAHRACRSGPTFRPSPPKRICGQDPTPPPAVSAIPTRSRGLSSDSSTWEPISSRSHRPSAITTSMYSASPTSYLASTSCLSSTPTPSIQRRASAKPRSGRPMARAGAVPTRAHIAGHCFCWGWCLSATHPHVSAPH